MTNTSILALPLLAANQTQKEITINDALSALERAVSDRLVVPLTADVTLALGDTTRYAIFVTSGNTATYTLTFPASKRFFFVKNGGTAPVTVAVTGVATTFDVPVNATSFYYADETSLSLLIDTTASGGTPASLLLLSDTPSSYAGMAGKALVVTAGEDGVTFSPVATDFVGLSDTPNSFSGAQGKFVKVNGAGTALEFIDGVSSFITLSDAPNSYAGQGTKIVAVKGGENGLEFIDIPSLSAQRTVNALLTVFDDVAGWTQTSGMWSIQSTFGSVGPSSYNDTFLVCNSPADAAGVTNLIEKTLDLTTVVTPADLDTNCELKIAILEASSYNDYGSLTVTFLSGSGSVLSTASTGNFTSYPDPSWISRTLTTAIPVGARSVKVSLGATNIEDATAVTHAYARLRVDVLVPLDSISTFLDLQDTPATYVASNRVRVNDAGDALEFVADTLLTLKDIPTITGMGGKVLKVKTDLSGFEWGDASTVGAIGDLSDVPDSRTGNAKKILRVKEDETGLEYVSPTVLVGNTSAQAEATTIQFGSGLTVTVGVGGVAVVEASGGSAGTLNVKEGVSGTPIITDTMVFDPVAFSVTDLGGGASQVASKANSSPLVYESTVDGNMDQTQFAGYSFGSPTVVKYSDGAVIVSGVDASNDHIHGIARAAPTVDFEVVARVSPESGHDDVGAGLVLIESSGVLTTAVLTAKTGLVRAVSRTWTNPTTSSALNFDVAVSPQTTWVKMAYTIATNALVIYSSVNGQDWQQVGTVTLTTDPQWVGLAASALAGVKASARVHYYADPTYTSAAILIGGGNLVGKRRFWRFVFEETQNGGAPALSGLTLRATVGGTMQVPTSSSQSSIAATGNEATRLYDSDTATAWIAGSTGHQWVDFDFGTAGVECVEIAATSMDNANFNQAPKSAQVMISDDGKFYQVVGEVAFDTWVQNETKVATLPSRLVASSYATDDVDTAANLAAKRAFLDDVIIGGTEGQVLTKTVTGYDWENPAAGGGGSAEVSTDTPHTYWRVFVTDSFSASYVNFYELSLASTAMGVDLTTSVGGVAIAGAGTAANAFDDTNATRWVATAADISAGNAWVGFQFASPVSVKEMRFAAAYTYGEMVKSWKLQYSDDGTLWYDVQSYTDTTPWTDGLVRAYGVTAVLRSVDAMDDVDITSTAIGENQIVAYDVSRRKLVPATVFGGVSKVNKHTFWRVRVTAGFSGSWVTIGELKFCATSGGANLATGGLPFSGKGNDCSALYDGDASVRYGIEASYIATNQCWFGYHFAGGTDVRFIGLGSSGFTGEMPTDFVVEVSDDGATWTAVQTFTDTNTWTSGEYRYYELTALSPVVGIGDLSDVDLTTPPTNGQALLWNSATNEFKPGDLPTSGGGGGGGLIEATITPPTIGAFTMGPGSTANTHFEASLNGLRIRDIASTGNTNNLRYVYQTPAGAHWRITGKFRRSPMMAYMGWGLVVAYFAGNKHLVFGPKSEGSGAGRIRFAAYNSYSGQDTWALNEWPKEFWLKMEYDGTNIYYYISNDGDYWTKLYQEAVTAFFGSAPDRVGWGVNCNHAGNNYAEPMIECLSWLHEAI